MRRRIYVASAERAEVDAAQLAFDALFAEVQSLSKELDAAAGDEDGDDEGEKTKRKTPPTGRRDLAATDLPVVRVELTDPELEGKAERIGFEESSRLGYERGGARRIVVARAVYKVAEPAVEAAVEPIADAPAESSPVTETPRIVCSRRRWSRTCSPASTSWASPSTALSRPSRCGDSRSTAAR
jgi:transposase